MDTIGILRVMIGDDLAREVEEFSWAYGLDPSGALAELVRRGVAFTIRSDENEEAADRRDAGGDGSWHVL